MDDRLQAAPGSSVDAGDGVPSAKRYRAFISYSHKDERWAKWLHGRLEGYRVPRRLRGSIGEFGVLPARLTPIFRDREDLASHGELGPRIQDAIAGSEALIVVCSPQAAQSRWVNAEITAFERLHGRARIYALIVAGEPNAGDDRECFPDALRHHIDATSDAHRHDADPIAADIRPGKDGKTLARLKLLAGLLGVSLDGLRQREARRRHQRMAAITALALLVMLVTSLLAVQAVIARRDAERRQKQAENLVTFMLGDLNDKLAKVQRLDIMEAVDDQAMNYFESLPTTDVTDAALSQRAKALKKIGSVRIDQGNLAGAMESYQAALKIARQLAEAQPELVERQLDYADIRTFIGFTHWYKGELDQAQAAFLAAQEILLRAQRHAPDSRPLIFQLATLDNNFGHVEEARGKLDDAARQYRSMLALCQQLVALEPGNAEWNAHLGLAHNNLGKLALMRGDLAGAIAAYQADDAIEARLAKLDPRDNLQQEKVAITRATLGRTLALTGQVEIALSNLREAVGIAIRLAAVDPDNVGFQEDLGLYGTQLAHLLRLSGQHDEAATEIEKSRATLQALTKKDPENIGWRREFAEMQLELAAQAAGSGQLASALQFAQSARAALDALHEGQPDDRSTLISTMAARLLLADLQADPASARQLRESALQLARGADVGDPRVLALQVDALLKTGQKAIAEPIIVRLAASGYADIAFTSLLLQRNIPYRPVTAAAGSIP